MQKHFMIDIESTGTDVVRDEILQIGVLELEFLMGYWRPGKSLEFELHTNRHPVSEFAKANQSELFEKCHNTPFVAAPAIRSTLLRFFKSCGAISPNVYVMGWNASGFDMPMLVNRGYLEPHRYVTDQYGKDQPAGDFHYRVYEIAGAIALAENVLCLDRSELIVDALALDTVIQLPEGRKHDALYDCYRQAKLLNGLIYMLSQRVPQ